MTQASSALIQEILDCRLAIQGAAWRERARPIKDWRLGKGIVIWKSEGVRKG
jgi:hypothetical protein